MVGEGGVCGGERDELDREFFRLGYQVIEDEIKGCVRHFFGMELEADNATVLCFDAFNNLI